jgi:hypothetical protein
MRRRPVSVPRRLQMSRERGFPTGFRDSRGMDRGMMRGRGRDSSMVMARGMPRMMRGGFPGGFMMPLGDPTL